VIAHNNGIKLDVKAVAFGKIHNGKVKYVDVGKQDNFNNYFMFKNIPNGEYYIIGIIAAGHNGSITIKLKKEDYTKYPITIKSTTTTITSQITISTINGKNSKIRFGSNINSKIIDHMRKTISPSNPWIQFFNKSTINQKVQDNINGIHTYLVNPLKFKKKTYADFNTPISSINYINVDGKYCFSEYAPTADSYDFLQKDSAGSFLWGLSVIYGKRFAPMHEIGGGISSLFAESFIDTKIKKTITYTNSSSQYTASDYIKIGYINYFVGPSVYYKLILPITPYAFISRYQFNFFLKYNLNALFSIKSEYGLAEPNFPETTQSESPSASFKYSGLSVPNEQKIIILNQLSLGFSFEIKHYIFQIVGFADIYLHSPYPEESVFFTLNNQSTKINFTSQKVFPGIKLYLGIRK
jgi:hypothetical protein